MTSTAEPVVEELPQLYARDDGLQVDAAATDKAWAAAHETVMEMKRGMTALRALVYSDGAAAEASDGCCDCGTVIRIKSNTRARAIYDELSVAYTRHCRSLETLKQLSAEERENQQAFFGSCIAIQGRRPPDMPLLAPGADDSVPVDTRNPTLGAAASYPRDDAPHGHLLQISIL